MVIASGQWKHTKIIMVQLGESAWCRSFVRDLTFLSSSLLMSCSMWVLMHHNCGWMGRGGEGRGRKGRRRERIECEERKVTLHAWTHMPLQAHACILCTHVYTCRWPVHANRRIVSYSVCDAYCRWAVCKPLDCLIHWGSLCDAYCRWPVQTAGLSHTLRKFVQVCAMHDAYCRWPVQTAGLSHTLRKFVWCTIHILSWVWRSTQGVSRYCAVKCFVPQQRQSCSYTHLRRHLRRHWDRAHTHCHTSEPLNQHFLEHR